MAAAKNYEQKILRLHYLYFSHVTHGETQEKYV